MTDDEVKQWVRDNWKESWWGGLDCDRCPNARGSNGSPCPMCPRWPYFVRDHRKRAAKSSATDVEWSVQHKAQALQLFRTQLAQALKPHVGLTDVAGHLTVEELQRELLVIYGALPIMITIDKIMRDIKPPEEMH